MKYEIVNTMMGPDIIKRTDDDGMVWFIPTDEANADYQAYLAYVAELESEPKV